MSACVRSRSRSRGRGDEEESSSSVETVAAQKPTEYQEPSTVSQEIDPGQEREEGISVDEGTEGKPQEMGLGMEKTGAERGDGPDVEGKTLPNVERSSIPGAGDRQ
uniref:GAGE domain-containing protein n=1 Tax=Otolemur garnettii TaxID=30611 RepID=H0XN00_OTOGA